MAGHRAAGHSAWEHPRERAYDPAIHPLCKRSVMRRRMDPGSSPGVTPVWLGGELNSIHPDLAAARSLVATPCVAPLAAHGSVAKRSRPVGLSVLASKVR